MVLLKRKEVEMVPPPDPADYAGEDPDVFYMASTGEIFLDYESYAQRLTFYNQPIFQDELTGKLNLTFFQALQSEREEALKLHKRFPESLKGPVLRSVQFVITGRLDNLIDIVFERFKDRYFAGEAVFVDLQGDKYYAEVMDVFPARALVRWHQQQAEKRAGQGFKVPPPAPSDVVHKVGVDLERNIGEATQIDHPDEYIYSVQLIDESGSFTGSLMEVRSKQLSRDRLTFSKTILKKYLRECVVRDTSVASPWIVRHNLAHRFGIPVAPTQAIIERHNNIKENKLSKRKKFPEEEEPAPIVKKRKTKAEKNAEKTAEKAADKAAAKAAKKAADKEAKKAAKKAAKAAEKEEMSTPVVKAEDSEEEKPKEKKKPIKFPVEDLEVDPVSERELKAKITGELPRRRDRPPPSKELGIPLRVLEPLLVTYHFLHAFGKVLHLAPFTLDDYDSALRHSSPEPCTLIGEVHATLINLIVRDGSYGKNAGPAVFGGRAAPNGAATKGAEEEEEEEIDEEEESGDELDSQAGSDDEAEAEEVQEEEEEESDSEVIKVAISAGRGWEKKSLKIEDGRAGWENSLLGVIAKRATPDMMPRMMGILSHLTGVEHPDGLIDGRFVGETYFTPKERYPVMPETDKLAAVQFLCELAVMTKAAKGFFDECEGRLTELRKERVELSRQRKKLLEERAAEEKKREEEAKQNSQCTEQGEAKDGDGDGAEEDGSETPAKTKDGKSANEEGTPAPDAAEDEPAYDSEHDELESSPEAEDRDGSVSNADGASDSDSVGPARRNLGSRQQALREKTLQRKAEEAARQAEFVRQRELQRAKNAEQKRILAEKHRWEAEEERIAAREEAIDLEFRRYLLAPRLRPMGKDRFHDRYWWFDGIGNQSLVAPNGAVQYGTGRLFVQGASAEDWKAACAGRKEKAVLKRREIEHGGSILQPDEWAMYDQPEQVEQIISWLRNKGNREYAFKRQLLTFRNYIGPGMEKRLNDLQGGWREFETRRSSRSSKGEGLVQHKYLAWTNTFGPK